MQRPALIKPGIFSIAAMADSRRGIFDLHNEAILASGLPVSTVFLGDSITEMWALDPYFQSPAGLIVNRGIGGDRTPFARRRFEADVVQLRPQLLVQKIGVNNSWDLDIVWYPEMRRTAEEIEEEIVTDTAAMLDAARAAGITVALCSILPTDVPFNGNTAARNALIAHANTRLRALAQGGGAVWVDYHSHLVAADGLTLRAGLADDGLHPHTVGYEIMATVLIETLDAAGITLLARRSGFGA